MELYHKILYNFKPIESLEEDVKYIENKIKFAKKHNLNILDRKNFLFYKEDNLMFEYQKDSDTFTNIENSLDQEYIDSEDDTTMCFSIVFYSIIDGVNVLHKESFFPDQEITEKNEYIVYFIDKYDYFDEKTNNKMFNTIKNNILSTDNCIISKHSYNYEKFNLIVENKIFL